MELNSTRKAFADRPARHPAPSCPPSWDARLNWLDTLIKSKTLSTKKFPTDELTHIIYPTSFAQNLQTILNVGALFPVEFAVRYGKKQTSLQLLHGFVRIFTRPVPMWGSMSQAPKNFNQLSAPAYPDHRSWLRVHFRVFHSSKKL